MHGKESFNVELIKPHSEECDAIVAVELGDWDTPWFLRPEKAFFKNDPTGSRGVRLICNDPRCRGEVVVHGLAVAVEHGLAEVPDARRS